MTELRLTLPRSWQELTERQLLFVASVINSMRSKYDLLIPVLMQFTGIRVHPEVEQVSDGSWYRHPSLKKPFILDDDQLVIMADRLSYLMDIDECNPIRWVKLARARHRRMYNATFEEYLMCENYFFAYTKTYQPNFLECLVSVLYRLPWQRWNSDKIEKRARWFRNIHQDKKGAIFLWYLGFRNYVKRRCPKLFSGSGSETDIRTYINGVIHTLNNGDITITDRLLKQPCWYALDELEQRAAERERIEKSQKHV